MPEQAGIADRRRWKNKVKLTNMRNYEAKPDFRVSAEVIADIVQIASEVSAKSIHYVGYADAELLKALKISGDYELSIMDMFNRTNRSTHFWNDEFELDLEKYPIPEWMDGITSYEEGAPDADLLLRDIPWDSANQFSKIVSFTKTRAPKHIVLFGDADLDTRHTEYIWDRRPKLTVGHKKWQSRTS